MRADNLEQILLYQKVKYFGSPFIPFTLFIISYRFYKREYPKPLIFISALIVPLFVFLLVNTGDYHDLYYESISTYPYQGYLITVREVGPLYPIGIIYNLFTITYSLVVFYRLLFKGPDYFKNAYLYLSIGLLFLTITAALYLLKLTPHSIDVLPIGFLGLAVAYAVTIFKFNLFGSQDIYHKVVFSNLQQGIIITDNRGYLIDFNRAAKRFFSWLNENNKGHNIKDFEYGDLIYKNENRSFSMAINMGDETIYTDFNVTEIKRKNKVVGYAYLFVDNTDRYLTMSQLRYYARHDSLTNVYNKKVITEEATSLIKRASDKKTTAIIILIDVDNFKKINDSYGHLAGDYVLREVAQEFLMLLDYVGAYGRYGGDEFLVVLTELPLRSALAVVRRLRKRIIEKKYIIENDIINVTLSVGIRFIDFQYENKDITLTELIQQADKALYRSKESGKNSIKIYKKNVDK